MTDYATITGLKALYATTKDDSALQPYVDTANLIVNEQLVGGSCTQSAARLTMIANYLAAHFAALSDLTSNAVAEGASGTLKSEKIGDATDTYSSVAANQTGLLATMFGQTAVSLDMCGILASNNANMGLKATFETVGGQYPGWPYGRYYGGRTIPDEH